MNNHKIEVGKAITIDGYTIKEGRVKTPKGNEVYVSEYRDMTAQERKDYAEALKKSGIIEPVIAGRIILPKKIADSAIRQLKAEREAVKTNVRGLEELRKAIDFDNSQRNAFRRSMNRGDGVIRGRAYSSTYKEVAKKYPRAAAYLKAEGYYNSSNYMKSSFGKEAMNKIASGKSASAAIREMEKKWRKYTSSRAHD